MQGTINGRPIAPYRKPDDSQPLSPRYVRDRTVYEPLLGQVNLPGEVLGPVLKTLLIAADAYGEREYVLGQILDRRRARLNYNTVLQRNWQAKVSRRPQRGKHHDSWALREKYVRAARP